jgi:hypothetical protein
VHRFVIAIARGKKPGKMEIVTWTIGKLRRRPEKPSVAANVAFAEYQQLHPVKLPNVNIPPPPPR